LAGGVTTAALLLASEVAQFAAVQRAGEGLDVEVARALLDVQLGLFVIAWLPLALFLAATATAGLQLGILPRWLAAAAGVPRAGAAGRTRRDAIRRRIRARLPHMAVVGGGEHRPGPAGGLRSREMTAPKSIDNDQEQTMSEHENVATIRGIYEAFARGDVADILSRLDAETEWHMPRGAPWSKILYRGPGEVAQFFGEITEQVADPTVETTELLTSGDRVVAQVCFRGRGMKSGVPFELPEAHIWKLAGGKVVEERSYGDTAAIVQALTATGAEAAR
jgi:ketosteroid isomerase-like protein